MACDEATETMNIKDEIVCVQPVPHAIELELCESRNSQNDNIDDDDDACIVIEDFTDGTVTAVEHVVEPYELATVSEVNAVKTESDQGREDLAPQEVQKPQLKRQLFSKTSFKRQLPYSKRFQQKRPSQLTSHITGLKQESSNNDNHQRSESLICTSNKKLWQCKMCFYHSENKHNLLSHVRNHTGEKPFQCPKCGARYKDSSSLKYHMASKNCSGEPN